VILDTAFHGHDTNQAAYDQLHAAGVDVKWAPNDVIYHQLSGGLTLEARVMGDGSGAGKCA
jgi:cardiolipin synthase